MGCKGLYWAVLGYSRLYRALPGVTGLYWAVLGCTGLFWMLVCCTDLYWSVVGYTMAKYPIHDLMFGDWCYFASYQVKPVLIHSGILLHHFKVCVS